MKCHEIDYNLKLLNSDSGTGYFKAVPVENIDLTDAAAMLHKRPMDDFLHRYALELLADFDQKQISLLIKKAKKEDDLILLTLACEQILLSGTLSMAKKFFSEKRIKEFKKYSPLINIRSALENNRRLHSKWIALFKKNIFHHHKLPALEDAGFPPICAGDCFIKQTKAVNIKDFHQFYIKDCIEKQEYSLVKTAEKALERLDEAGVQLEQEMRHESSLSPFALLRKWHFTTRTDNNRNIFSLSGEQTSYGRGLTLENARASLLMEIVERCSAFASVTSKEVAGYENHYPVEYASYSQFVSAGRKAVNPHGLALEIKYSDEPLHWIKGTTPAQCFDRPAAVDGIKGYPDRPATVDGTTEYPDRPAIIDGKKTPADEKKEEDIFIPVQALFLFCNLDEISIFSGLGSTGLASGNTLEQAKVSALLEVIERHQAATVPFDRSTCFSLVSNDKEITGLLESYKACGIAIWFQDITPGSGIPCCSCFVRGRDGRIHRGTSAKLNAKKAIISAMTETDYPFPKGPPSREAPVDLTIVGFENLPDFSTGEYSSDLALMEQLLISNNCQPCYVDLTQKDIGIPVVKAVIPGMEITGDFDQFSRVHPELFQNYLKTFNPGQGTG